MVSNRPTFTPASTMSGIAEPPAEAGGGMALDELLRPPARLGPRPALPAAAAPRHAFAAACQSAWMARVLATSRPKRHVDVSDDPRFAAVISAFVPVHHYGPSAPAADRLPGFRATRARPHELPLVDRSVESLSTCGLVEHVAADDPIDVRQVLGEIDRVLAPDGSLLLACPIGRPRPPSAGLARVFAFGQILDHFPAFELEEFSLIPLDAGPVLTNPDPDERLAATRHGLGCFWFRKPA